MLDVVISDTWHGSRLIWINDVADEVVDDAPELVHEIGIVRLQPDVKSGRVWIKLFEWMSAAVDEGGVEWIVWCAWAGDGLPDRAGDSIFLTIGLDKLQFLFAFVIAAAAAAAAAADADTGE